MRPAKKGSVTDMLNTDRAIPKVKPPSWEPLPSNEVWDKNTGLPNLANLKAHFLAEGLLHEKDVVKIVGEASALMRKEPNLLRLKDPLTVCGDIHGQFYDLCKLFEIGGSPDDQQYLFLGDYVDRGCFGCEVVLYLMAAKICHPKTFYLLRGNHECAHLTSYFNFKSECLYKYNTHVYEKVLDCFMSLPLAAVLNNRFLCVHGGLSPDVKTLDDINSIARFRDPPGSGPMCDLLWADPMEEEEDTSPELLYLHNDLRGCSYVFSYNAVCKFLSNNNLLSIIRAHEAQDEGYKLYKKSPTGFPSVICIFSAPNYCDSYDNKAAIIRFQNNLMNIRQFNSSTHPYYLPNFMNAFSWSMPFVAEKVTDMLITMWNVVDEDMEVDQEELDKESALLRERGAQLRSKIVAMGRMARMYKSIRQHNESALALKGISTKGLELTENVPSAGILGFKDAKKYDLINEKRPAVGK
ncbi:Calcineurin subunit A [Diplonema papillatum]|nr:Calcineurin subunit A [Diplonema papillatum]